MNEQAFYIKLMQFNALLQKENKILINQKPTELEQIVAKKESFIEVINAYQGEITTEIKQALIDIKTLQEQNLLLTQMEMAYAQTLMDAVRQSVKTANNPYGKQKNANQQAATLLVNTDM